MEVTSSSLVPLILVSLGNVPGAFFWVTDAAFVVRAQSVLRGCSRVDEGVGAVYYPRLPSSVDVRDCSRRCTCALVAQLDRASDYGSEGWGFEFLQAHGRYWFSAGRSVAR